MTMDCVICLQPARDQQMLPCQHVFCRACIQSWLEVNNRCPMCSEVIGGAARNTLTGEVQEQEGLPCVDHLYPQRNSLRMKLMHLNTRIQTKKDASVKACISKGALNDLKDRQQELEELFDLFSLLVDQGGNIGEAVALMETINFGMLEMEEVLEGRLSGLNYSPEECLYEEFMPYDYEDDFPDIELHSPQKQKKRKEKGRTVQPVKKGVK